jgi:C-terminal of Roc, COR, domain/Ras of Complex, Roc, domain of DAPkinase/Leucine rich repeat
MAKDEAYYEAERRIEEARRSHSTTLSLREINLTEVPESIASLTQLQELFLQNNQLTSLPEAIASLTQLQLLHLSSNQLTSLPEAIASLIQLKKLYLFNNQLTTLPESITSLTQLRELYLDYNQLTSLPESIASLSQLQVLFLSNNQLKSLPQSIASLTQIRGLSLSNNQLTNLPEAIASLTRLQELSLDNNQLTSLPEAIASLTRLQKLSLNRDQLTSLPEAIGFLRQLQELYLFGNPLNPDLATAYEDGIEAVQQYLCAQAQAKIHLYEAKLILIGEGEVGKSCLLSALRGEPWVENRSTTHGIEIKPVSVTHPDSNIEITLNGWDFGGQPIYRPTHQLFFTAPAIYLVIWKPREGPQQGFVKEWITLIKHREPTAKILIVSTHGGPRQRQPDIDCQELYTLFGTDTILGFHSIDSKPDPTTGKPIGIDELKDAIAQTASTLPEMGRTVPAKWQEVRDHLQTLDTAYLSYQAVLQICQDHGIAADTAPLFVRISHILGHLIHYDYDSVLRDIVILKPDWLAKAISFILDDRLTRDRQGIIDFPHLSHIWHDPQREESDRYPRALHPAFLRLMERFDLSYRINLDPNPNPDQPTSLIAQLVRDNRPESFTDHWTDQPESGDRQQTQICHIVDDRGQFAIAEGLFYQLIVRLHKYSLGRDHYDQSIHWQRGLLLDDTYNGRAFLEQQSSSIHITVSAAYPEFFLNRLTQDIKWLVENFWEGLRCQVLVPCLHPCDQALGLFKVQKLIESRRKGRTEYPCDIAGCDEWQNIDRLLHNAPIAAQSAPALTTELSQIKTQLDGMRSQLTLMDRNNQKGFLHLDRNDRALLSKIDDQYTKFIQCFTDEAKDGPRLFSLKPLDAKLSNPQLLKIRVQLTLWCEHSRQPLPFLDPDAPDRGVYILDLPRDWFRTAAPYLKFLSTTLSLVRPIATAATKLTLDDPTYKGIEEQLDFGQKSLESTLKSSDLLTQTSTDRTPDLTAPSGSPIRADGAALRQLHIVLKAKDPSFGGLIRVQNKRQEFLWIHPQYVEEY